MLTLPSYQSYLDAKRLLLDGELVAFPTETVYGLGANALDSEAVAKIFKTKGRPQKNPIIVHLGDVSQIVEYADIENQIQQTIIDQLMPGPLTILLKKKSCISDVVTSGSEFVGIRIPSNEVALKLLQTVGLPIAAPSANISTKPSPTTAQMVWDNFHENIPMILDGGSCEVGIESTVVKVEDQRVIITRPGYISKEDLEGILPKSVVVEYAQTVSEITPGNMFKHYAPKGKVCVITDPSQICSPSVDAGSVCLLATDEFIERHTVFLQEQFPQLDVLSWGTHANLITCANRLFSAYHECDQRQYSFIYVEDLSGVGLAYAIMNRVRKSAEG